MLTIQSLKAQAKRLRAYLESQNLHLSHSQALEAVAAAQGFRDWRTASGLLLADVAGAAAALPDRRGQSSAPVGRIPSAKTSRALAQARQLRGMQSIADALFDENLSQDDLYGLFAKMANLRERSTPLGEEEAPLVIQILERMGQGRLSE